MKSVYLVALIFGLGFGFFFEPAFPLVGTAAYGMGKSRAEIEREELYEKQNNRPYHRPEDGINITREYRTIWNEMKGLDPETLKELQSYRILFVGGLFSEVILDFEDSFLSYFYVEGYYSEQMADLKRKQVKDLLRIRLDSQQGMVNNAHLIRRAILASDKPVLVIGHSKGGLDLVEALRPQSGPEAEVAKQVREKVKGMILIQSPFEGSPVAENFYLNRNAMAVLLNLGGRILEVFDQLAMTDSEQKRYRTYLAQRGGAETSLEEEMEMLFLNPMEKEYQKWFRAMLEAEEPSGVAYRDWCSRHLDLDLCRNLRLSRFNVVRDLSTTFRYWYNQTYWRELQFVRATIPNISVGTWVEGTTISLLGDYRDEMEKQGIVSDGVVPLDSSFFGGKFVELKDVDHGNTIGIMAERGDEFDRVRFMRSLWVLLLREIRQNKKARSTLE